MLPTRLGTELGKRGDFDFARIVGSQSHSCDRIDAALRLGNPVQLTIL
jgi:hypothetical protein